MAEDEALQLRMVIARLEVSLRELDIRPSEVSAILGIEDGGWPMPITRQWSPVKERLETRLRHLGELCDLVVVLFGAEAVGWLRARGPVLTSPIAFLISNADALSALRAVLKDGVGERR